MSDLEPTLNLFARKALSLSSCVGGRVGIVVNGGIVAFAFILADLLNRGNCPRVMLLFSFFSLNILGRHINLCGL